MKLYLSSFHLGNEPGKLSALFGTNKKIALISNALDFSKDLARRKEGDEEEVQDLKSLGLEPELLDLRDYFGKRHELAEKMKEYGGVWVRGGNTFILRRAYKETGFDEWLRTHKADPEFVYSGYSAGVCVLSPNLHGLELVDEPNAPAEGYDPKIVWDGIGLIPFAFAPHYKSNHPESEMVSREVEYYDKIGTEYKTLHDGEAIVMTI